MLNTVVDKNDTLPQLESANIEQAREFLLDENSTWTMWMFSNIFRAVYWVPLNKILDLDSMVTFTTSVKKRIEVMNQMENWNIPNWVTLAKWFSVVSNWTKDNCKKILDN